MSTVDILTDRRSNLQQFLSFKNIQEVWNENISYMVEKSRINAFNLDNCIA